jgi:hypothetical protein
MRELILRRLRERRLPPIALILPGLASWLLVAFIVRVIWHLIH